MKLKQAGIHVVIALTIGVFSSCGLGRNENNDGPVDASKAPTSPHFKPGFNLFSPQQDIEMGRQSAAQIVRQMPLIRDAEISGYIKQLGAKLAAKAPGEKFPYNFEVIGDKQINAFALPGGFIFVNAGAIASAHNEGELAGVMAHEIMHVALRHGTSQATKAYAAKAGLGILGTIVAAGTDRSTGAILAQMGGAGANMLFLKFGRTAERQSDIEGARILAAAGYDPRDMAAFFKTLQEKGGQGVPEFLSDHPDPGNRIASINALVPSLTVSSNPTRTTQEFETVKARLTGRAPSLSDKSLARVGPADPTRNTPGTSPPPPSTSFSGFQAEDGSFALEFPSNWKVARTGAGNYIVAPEGAFAQVQDSVLVTHGIFIGVIPPLARDLGSATRAFIEKQIQDNPDFRIVREPQQIDFGGQPGYAAVISGPSNTTGVPEINTTYTTATSDGRLFYVITISPETELNNYQQAFQKIMQSLRLRG